MKKFTTWVEAAEQNGAISIKEWKDKKWVVLAALYNAAGILNMGFIQATDPNHIDLFNKNKGSLNFDTLMTEAKAKQVWDECMSKYAYHKHETIFRRDEDGVDIDLGKPELKGGFLSFFHNRRVRKAQAAEDAKKASVAAHHDLMEEGRKTLWDKLDTELRDMYEKDPTMDFPRLLGAFREKVSGFGTGTGIGALYDPQSKRWNIMSSREIFRRNKEEYKDAITPMDMIGGFMEAHESFSFDYFGGKPIKITLHPYQEYITAYEAYMYSNRNSPEDEHGKVHVDKDYCARVIDTLRKTGDSGSKLMVALGNAGTEMNFQKIAGVDTGLKKGRTPFDMRGGGSP